MPEFDPYAFALRLREYRKLCGLTQSELATALNVSRSVVSKWEEGKGKPAIDQVVGLSIELHVPLSTLVFGDCSRDMTLEELKQEIAQVHTLLGVLMLRYIKLSTGK